ncbi:SCO family protein [Salisaeta longa]|uniref:SCO family protein n=1 Tax=Salisaeta longa TaxID=503170 RepID=UPI0003B545D8|nr:SCO family protein [Salisaeta longa]
MGRFIGIAILAIIMLGCQSDAPRVIDPLADASVTLVTQDSQRVVFPTDFEGTPTVVGAIYTHCPDVCPLITANMKEIRRALGPDTARVQFVSITFDPQRDTPQRLAEYRALYSIQDPQWPFLTGDTSAINRAMATLNIVHKPVTPAGDPVDPDTASAYTFLHTDRIVVLDAQGRLRARFSGSRTPPDMVVETIEALQSEWMF